MKRNCNRCGKCCSWQLEGMEKPETCKYLTGGKIKICRIYKNQDRLGEKIGEWQGIPIRCTERKNDKIIINGKSIFRYIEGCALNDT